MIELEVMLFGMLGALTSLAMGIFITEGKSIRLNILLVLVGAFTGWIGGIIWVAMTGGLEITLFALIIPVAVSALFSFLILNRISARYLGNTYVSKQASTWALVALFILAFGIAYTAIPAVYSSTANVQTFSVSPIIFNPNEQLITTSTYTTATNTIPMDIDYIGSSATLSTMAENPITSSYYNFKIYITPKVPWTSPYIKMAIYKDTNEDGKLNQGDVLWSDADYKLSTENTKWRINCLWQGDVPQYGVFTSNGKMLPIFHANDITKAKDETNINFQNTPEGFIPASDMLSWNQQGLLEQVVNYATVNGGETTTIQGKAFCSPDKAGQNIIVVRTYDVAYASPFMDAQPIQEKIITFSVTTTPQDTTIAGLPVTSIALILGFLVIIAFIVAKKEGEL